MTTPSNTCLWCNSAESKTQPSKAATFYDCGSFTIRNSDQHERTRTDLCRSREKLRLSLGFPSLDDDAINRYEARLRIKLDRFEKTQKEVERLKRDIDKERESFNALRFKPREENTDEARWEKARRKILSIPNGITARDLYNGRAIAKDKLEAESMLSKWVAVGRLIRIEPKFEGSGRKVVRYKLTPVVKDQSQPSNEVKKEVSNGDKIIVSKNLVADAMTASGHESQWARLPKPGRHLEGLTRPYLYRLIAAGKVKSISIVPPGSRKGVRLVNIPSLREFLSGVAEKQLGSAV
jgi:hypothetical protein